MKSYFLWLLFPILLCGCMGKEKGKVEKADSLVSVSSADLTKEVEKTEEVFEDMSFWEIDVTKTYPRKSISIQSIADVKYIPIETNDSMLWRGGDMKYVREDMIIAGNNSVGIMVYGGNGKALYSFGKRGAGPEEYGAIDALCFDKDAGELYAFDLMGCRVKVYGIKGDYRRTLSLPYSGKHRVYRIVNLNKNELLAYISNDIYACLSKKDGSIIKEKRFCTDKDFSLAINKDGQRANVFINTMVKQQDRYILTAYASDTTYIVDRNFQMRPFGKQSPKVLSMDPPVFLFFGLDAPDFSLAYSVKKVWDFEKNEGFPRVNYLIDKKRGGVWTYDYFINDDYVGFEVDVTHYNEVDTEYGVAVLALKASQLVEARKGGKLKGELKKMTENMQEDDNPILMVVKFKNRE